MGLRSFFKSMKFGVKAAPKKIVGQVQNILGTLTWSGQSDEALIKEGYEKCVVAFRAIDVTAKALASIPIIVKVNNEVRPDHPLKTLLDQPNPLVGGSDFFEYLTTWHRMLGNAYVEMVGPDGKPPKELWIWPADQIKIRTSKGKRIPDAYVYTNSESPAVWPVDAITGESLMMQWKTFNPRSNFYGMSPLMAAAWEVDQHNSSSEWNKRALQNGGVPSMILYSEETVDDQQYEQIQRRMSDFLGSKGARKTMVVEGGQKVENVGFTSVEMDWLEGRKMAAREVASVFGVPAQVIPIPGDQTYANYAEARLALYEDTVLPLFDSLLDELNRWLAPRYPDKPVITYDPKTIPALAEKWFKQMLDANGAKQLSINERRALSGFAPKGNPEDPDDPHNQILISSSEIPIDMDFNLEPSPSEGTSKAINSALKDYGLIQSKK